MKVKLKKTNPEYEQKSNSVSSMLLCWSKHFQTCQDSKREDTDPTFKREETRRLQEPLKKKSLYILR